MKLIHLFESTGTDWSDHYKDPIKNDLTGANRHFFDMQHDTGFLGLFFSDCDQTGIRLIEPRPDTPNRQVSFTTKAFDGSPAGDFLWNLSVQLRTLTKNNKAEMDEDTLDDFEEQVEDFARDIITHRSEIAETLYGMSQKQLFGSFPTNVSGLTKKLLSMFEYHRELKHHLVHESDERKVYKIGRNGVTVEHILQKTFGMSKDGFSVNYGICITEEAKVSAYDISATEGITRTEFYTEPYNGKDTLFSNWKYFSKLPDLKKDNAEHYQLLIDFASQMKFDTTLSKNGDSLNGTDVFIGLLPDSAFTDFVNYQSTTMQQRLSKDRLYSQEENRGYKFDDFEKVASFFAANSTKAKTLAILKSVIKAGNTANITRSMREYLLTIAKKQGFSKSDFETVHHLINGAYL